MATITGLTAARMLAIEAATVTGGAYDSAGHLILEKHDGTQVDAGPVPTATESVKGISELATAAEAAAGVDTSRVVTAATLGSVLSGRDQAKILDPASFNNDTPTDNYPLGESYLSFSTSEGTTSNWGFGTDKAGTIRTYKRSEGSATQLYIRTFDSTTTPEMWFRHAGATTGWATWQKVGTGSALVSHIDSTKSQTDGPSTYPSGVSIMALDPATIVSGGWTGLTAILSGDISGIVHTVVPNAGGAVQYFYRSGTASTTPAMAMRCGDSAGWGSWQRVILYNEYETRLAGLPKAMAGGRVTITPVADTPTSLTVSLPAGRFTTEPNIQLTVHTSVPGSSVIEVSADTVTTTSFVMYLYRVNNVNTNVWWLATEF